MTTFPKDPNLGTRDEQKRREANARLAERDRQNVPWSTWERAQHESKCFEYGKRFLVRCNLPYTSEMQQAHDILQSELVMLAGGFTSYGGSGAWRNGKGKIEIENLCIYEVSVRDTVLANQVIEAFRNCGRATGQDWTHITTNEERAHHTQTSKV